MKLCAYQIFVSSCVWIYASAFADVICTQFDSHLKLEGTVHLSNLCQLLRIDIRVGFRRCDMHTV